MKTIKTILMNTLFFGLILIQSTSLFAQDPMTAASNVYKKVLLDNDQVKVMEVVFAPGATAAWHNHPNHSVYALTSGIIQITDEGKAPTTIDINMGAALYLSAVKHMAKNVGSTTLKFIVTEIKPAK